MSFTRYEIRDSVASSETVVRGLWSGDVSTLATFYTSSTQVSAEVGKYYTDVYNTAATSSVQFSIQYGHISGSGSININPDVDHYSVSRVVYGQYRNLIYGSEDTAIKDGSGNPIADVFVVNIARTRYKESIKPGSLKLQLSGSSGMKYLTDDSQTLSTTNFIDSNRYYTLRSGSEGNLFTSDTTEYGYLFPDLGVLVLNPSNLTGYVTTPTRTTASDVTDPQNAKLLFNSLVLGATFKLQSQETVSSRYFFTRVYNGDYNYTTNPSVIDDQGNLLYSTLIDNPQTYITTVGLYNDNNELLAVAKLSKPLVKDFTKELLLRVKLDY
jgi:hypothetical protein